MTLIKITGASDDLIMVNGDLREEFYPGEENSGHLLFSDGTIVRVFYDNDGIWRVTRLATGTALFGLVQGDRVQDTFDVATLEGDLTWCFFSKEGQLERIKKHEIPL